MNTSGKLLVQAGQNWPEIVVIATVAAGLVWLLRVLSGRLIGPSSSPSDRGRERQIRTLVAVTNSAFTVVILAVAGLDILDQLRISVGPLLAGAGVAGLAIGFGAQTLVKDLLNGFFVLLDDQYRVGDSIRAAGVQGKVERLTLRRTVLRDDDGTLYFVPNSALQVVGNLTRDWSLARLQIAVHYREDSDRVVECLRQAGREVRRMPALCDRILGDAVVPGIERISGDEVDYLIQLQTAPGAQAEVLRALRAEVKRQLRAAGIEAWYPQFPPQTTGAHA